MRRDPFFERVRRSARDTALARPELRRDTTPRRPAAGAVSAAVKVTDAATRALIDEALARRAPR